MAGKFSANVMAFPSPSHGLIAIGGFPRNRSTLVGWFDRSTDAGRRWTVGRHSSGATKAATQIGMTFSSAQQGWAYQPDLLFTTDGGMTWHADPSEPALIGPVSTVGSSTWVTGYRCPRGDCPARLYRTGRVGGRLTLLPNQPPGGDAVEQMLRPDARTAWLLLGGRRGHQRLATTSDGGSTWSIRPLPCTSGASLSAAGRGPLWLLCPRMTRTCSLRDQFNVIYQSNDNGATWTRTSTKRIRCAPPMTLYAVSGSIAWASETTIGSGSLLRTTDAGRTWHAVLTGTDDKPLTPEAITTAGTDRLAFVQWQFTDRGVTFTLERTVDAGRTWRSSPLPVPAGLAG